MIFSITSDQLVAFRNNLYKEMFGSHEWYKCYTKEKNKDVIVFHPECPYAISKKGAVSLHRYVWWLHHKNEPIGYNEMIHHINGNHQDNRIENLEKVKMKQHGQKHKKLKEMSGISISAIQKLNDFEVRDTSCCPTPTCESSRSPPFTGLTCGSCGADCKECYRE